MIVKTEATLKGLKSSEKCTALVDVGAVMTIIDKGLAEVVGVTYTGRRRSLTSATRHKLQGEIAIVRELTVEDEVLDYEKVLVAEFDGEVKKSLGKTRRQRLHNSRSYNPGAGKFRSKHDYG